MRRVPSDEARAVISFVEPSTRLKPLNDGVLHDGGDLIAKSDEVLVQGVTARGIERSVGRGKRLRFIWIRRSEIDWPADMATSIADMPRLRLSVTDE